LRNPKFSTISKTQIIQTLASNDSYASHTSHTRKLDKSGSTDALPLVYTKIDSRCDNDCKTIPTSDSGLLVAFDIYDGNFGSTDVVLIKYNPNGEQEWTTQIGGVGAESVSKIVESDDYFGFAGSSSTYSRDKLDCWIGKLSKSGDYLNSKVVYPSQLTVTDDCTIMALGALNDGGMVFFGNSNLYSDLYNNSFFRRY
jgi:hypothetical protein